MTTKQSRMARSSSLGEIGMCNQIQPIDFLIPSWEKKRPAPLAIPQPSQEPAYNASRAFVRREPHERPTFTIGSPVRSSNFDCSEGVDERFGVFFQACHLCKKEFDEKDHVYMYSYLRAFCSTECRDEQYSHDEKNNKLPDTPTISEVYLRGTGIAFDIQAKNKVELEKERESQDLGTQAKKKPIIPTSFKYV